MFNLAALFLASEYTTVHAGKHGWLQSRNRFHPSLRDVHSRPIHAAFIARLRQQGMSNFCLDECMCNGFVWPWLLGEHASKCMSKVCSRCASNNHRLFFF